MLYLSQCVLMLYEQFGKAIDIHMTKHLNMLDKTCDRSCIANVD